MPRRTRPAAKGGHTRAHVVASRRRVIDSRLRRLEREAALSAFTYPARWAGAAAGRELDDHFAPVAGERPDSWAPRWPGAGVLVRLPADVARRSGLGAKIGRFADEFDAAPYCQGCTACKPYRHRPGHRTRVRREFDEEIRAGLEAWHDGDGRLDGRRVGPRTEPRASYGWC